MISEAKENFSAIYYQLRINGLTLHCVSGLKPVHSINSCLREERLKKWVNCCPSNRNWLTVQRISVLWYKISIFLGTRLMSVD